MMLYTLGMAVLAGLGMGVLLTGCAYDGKPCPADLNPQRNLQQRS